MYRHGLHCTCLGRRFTPYAFGELLFPRFWGFCQVTFGGLGFARSPATAEQSKVNIFGVHAIASDKQNPQHTEERRLRSMIWIFYFHDNKRSITPLPQQYSGAHLDQLHYKGSY